MPSETEVRENGYSLRKINRGFLRTIEELMLHTIAQEEKISALKAEVAQYKSLREEVEKLKLQMIRQRGKAN